MTTNPEHRPDMPVSKVFDDWRDSNPRVRSKETVRLMQLSLASFEALLGHPALLSDLDEKNMTTYIRHRTDVMSRSPRTVEREAAKITTLWRWAAKRGWCRMPMISFRKAKPPSPIAWDRHELNRLYKAAAEYDRPIAIDGSRGAMLYVNGNGICCGVVMVALIRLLMESGERITAVLAVTWADVDLDRRWINFRADTRKGGDRASDNGQRMSRLTCRALRALRAVMAEKGVAESGMTCFPKKHKASYYFHLNAILRNAGLPVDRKHKFHCLRRTHATHLYLAGGDATLSLGHASDSMTREYYLDPRFVHRDSAADLLNGGLTGPIRRLFRRAKAAFGLW